MKKLIALSVAVGIVLGAAVVLAWPVQLLWNNALVGAIDGVCPIGFWQALGVTILCNILFKGTSSK
jgi:hypothetical protein